MPGFQPEIIRDAYERDLFLARKPGENRRRFMITEEQGKAILTAENAVKNDPTNSEHHVELGNERF